MIPSITEDIRAVMISQNELCLALLWKFLQIALLITDHPCALEATIIQISTKTVRQFAAGRGQGAVVVKIPKTD